MIAMQLPAVYLAVVPTLVLTMALSLCPLPWASALPLARAGDVDDRGDSHDRARRAAAAGEILPIAEIYARTLRKMPGRVLDAELERERGRWIYELKVLRSSGERIDLALDAATGEILAREADR